MLFRSGAAAAAIDRPLHTLNDRLEILRLYVGVAFVGIGGIERVSFYFFEYMRTYPIAAIGYDGTEVCHLNRCCQHLALSDRYRYYVEASPAVFAVYLVVSVGVRYESSILVGEIDAEFMPEPEGYDIFFPLVECIFYITVFGIVEHLS